MTVGRLLNVNFRDPGLNLLFGPNRITRIALMRAIQTEIYKTASASAWTDTVVLDWAIGDPLTPEDEQDLVAAIARSEQVFAPGESPRALQNYTASVLDHLTSGIVLCPRIGVPRNLTSSEAQVALDEITFGRSVSSAITGVVARALAS